LLYTNGNGLFDVIVRAPREIDWEHRLVQNSGSQDETAKLLSFVRSIEFDTLPEATRERTKDLVLDHVGVALFGSTMEWSRILQNVVGSEGGVPESTIYGAGRTSARGAALINGSAAHAIELDDTHDESLSHPGAAIIPAALALAEANKVSGAAFLTAVVAGYEAMGRVGSAVAAELLHRGFHPTAQLGVFGATAAAGRVLGLTAQELTRAFGIAASMSSGSLKFTQDAEGTMIKRLHAGMPAERGVLAAKLAAGGFTGPSAAIEGAYGFATIFTGVTDLTRMISDLGGTLEIERISVKLYSCCRMFHSLIEAVADCRAMPGFSADQIASIEAHGPRKMIDGHLEYRPLSTMAAQYSLPYTVAVATLSDPTSPASFSISEMQRPDMLAIADKVQGKFSAEFEALYPKRNSSRVVFEMKDGRKFDSTKLDSRSTPQNPIGRAEMHEKFRSVTRDILSLDQQAALIDCVMSLDRAPSIENLTKLLGSDKISPRLSAI